MSSRLAASLLEAARAPVARDLDGLPIAPERERSIAVAVATAAAVWFALAAAWELFGPILAGHYASSASVGIIAENMLRWKIAGPVWEYTTSRPRPDMYYCHHPWGIFWTTAAFMKVLGRHDYVCRLPAVLLSAATPPLLYGIGRSVWRPAAGAIAAAAFVVLPITLGFANMNALEVPVTAWSLLALLGAVRFFQTWRTRWLVAGAAGLAFALNADWPAFVVAGALLGLAALDVYVLGGATPRTRATIGLALGALAAVYAPWPTFLVWPARFALALALGVAVCVATFRPVDVRRFAPWWALWTAITAGTLFAYVALFARYGKLGDLVGAYALRSTGNEASLGAVLESRRYWIELSFSSIAIALGKLAAIVALARALVTRRAFELVPLIVLAMAIVQYVVFKQGADIHVFWPHYFAAFFALGLGALLATLAWLVEAAPLVALRPAAGSLALAVLALPIALVARDGVPALRYARETGGRFNEKGLLIDSDGDKTAFLRWLAPTLAPDAFVGFHDSMRATWAQAWALGGRVIGVAKPLPSAPTPGSRDVYLVDTRFLPDDAQQVLARGFHVVAVGPFWKIALGEAPAPIDAFAFDEREPTVLEAYFVSGTEPHRSIAPDPFATWELRTHFGQPTAPPTEPPRTLDQKRIAHNIAVAAGDAGAAEALERDIVGALRPLRVGYSDGTEIVGASYAPGARNLLTVLVRAGGPQPPDTQLVVRSSVVGKAAWSTTMPDPTRRDVGLPLPIAPSRWRLGFFYADRVPIRKRPGTEIFEVALVSRRGAAHPVGVAPSTVECLRLE